MGTYHDSKFVRARKDHVCAKCDMTILKGTEYLRYKLGLKWDIKVCENCGCQTQEKAWGKMPVYDCKAVRDRIGMLEPSTMIFRGAG